MAQVLESIALGIGEQSAINVPNADVLAATDLIVGPASPGFATGLFPLFGFRPPLFTIRGVINPQKLRGYAHGNLLRRSPERRVADRRRDPPKLFIAESARHQALAKSSPLGPAPD